MGRGSGIWAFILILLFLSGCSGAATGAVDDGCLAEELVSDYVIINEILAHSDPPFEDAIELYNPGAEAVCLGGWFLSDDEEELQKYRILEGTQIGAGEYLVLYAQKFNAQPGQAGNFGLSEYGEDIYLTAYKDGEETGYRDGGSFPASVTNQALGRHVASDGITFISLQQPTFGVDNPGSVVEFRQGGGAINASPLVGPIVISEMLYDPAGDGSEYLALTNISEQPVALYLPAHPTFTWHFTDGIRYEFPAGSSIAPGETILVVESDPEVFRSQNDIPLNIFIFGPYEGKLSNEGERVSFARPDKIDLAEGILPYVLVDSLAYRNGTPWPDVVEDSGTAILKLDLAASGDDAANWQTRE